MGTVLSYDKGKEAIRLARNSMESYVVNGKRERPGCMEEAFYEHTGVLVKLNSTRGRGSVRGSAASYKREKHLSDAIVDAVIEASSGSSGRSEIKDCELDTISVTLCTLQSMKELGDDYYGEIEVGRHGIIVENGRETGWMLPTMPVDYGWDTPEFLDRTCCKAGLNRGSWDKTDIKVIAFEGQIFREEEPWGEIEEIDLAKQKV